LGQASERAWLAHGDFDPSHIYQHQGSYSGIIDFGEIRGAGCWYDLAHVRLHDGELVPTPLLPWLLDGYAEVTPLAADLEQRLQLSGLLIALHALARSHARQRPGESDYGTRLRAAIARDILVLKP
jgi:Ser/Thr protein kinase RdoA (MazF antagonist)